VWGNCACVVRVIDAPEHSKHVGNLSGTIKYQQTILQKHMS